MPRIPTLIESPRGNGSIIGVNRGRLAEVPYFLLTNPPNNSVAVAASQASPMQVMTISGEGADLTADVFEMTAESNFAGPVTVEGDVDIVGAVGIKGATNIAGPSQVEGDFNVLGAQEIEGNLTVEGIIEGVIVPPK